MTLLVDYDNLHLLMRRRGARHAITSLVEALGLWQPAWGRRVTCRLYGGWLHGSSLSRDAQRLIPDVQREFPRSIRVRSTGGAHAVICEVQLARSLACDPAVVLTHTYRPRSLPRRLQCDSAPFSGCVAPSQCPIAPLEPFISNTKCPVTNCSVEPETVLARAEQKLVDSMLIVDLVHFADTMPRPLVVVSADEDLWPGIRFALLRGAQIIHVLPPRSRVRVRRYQNLETNTYSRVIM